MQGHNTGYLRSEETKCHNPVRVSNIMDAYTEMKRRQVNEGNGCKSVSKLSIAYKEGKVSLS